MKRRPSIAFLFIGGAHQIFHAAPIGAELALKARDASVEMLCVDAHDEALIRDVLSLYGVDNVAVRRLDQSAVGQLLRRLLPRRAAKLPLLLACRAMLNAFDAIVVPERTSAWLPWLGVRRPKLIHVRHGAGDRAPASERRLGIFDLVVVPGPKDARRAIDAGRVDPARIAVVGYVKFDLMRRMRRRRTPLFANRRPTVLYNAHFDPALSSWDRDARELIEQFRAQDAYNLIVAPHIRLFQDASPEERAAWEALAEPGKIIVDLGSDRSIDMTYTLAATSTSATSQVSSTNSSSSRARASFSTLTTWDWQRTRNMPAGHLGEVVRDPIYVLPAVALALAAPQARAAPQRAALADAIGGGIEGAAARGADVVLSYLDREAA